jgi:hypothetical protein
MEVAEMITAFEIQLIETDAAMVRAAQARGRGEGLI